MSRKVYVLTGIVWRTKPTKNVVTPVWSPLVLFPIQVDVSVIPLVLLAVNVTRDLYVINMVIALLLNIVQVCIALIMKFTQITIIHVMKTVVPQSLVVLPQLLFNLVACARKALSEITLAVSSKGVP